MNAELKTEYSGPMCSSYESERLLQDLVESMKNLEEYRCILELPQREVGRTARLVDAGKRLASSSLAAARRFSTWYARLAINGDVEKYISQATTESPDTAAVQQRLDALSSNIEFRNVVRQAGVSDGAWGDITHSLADPSLRFGVEDHILSVASTTDEQMEVHLSFVQPTQDAFTVMSLLQPDMLAVFASMSPQALQEAIITPRQDATRELTVDDAILAAAWTPIHGIWQQVRELEDYCVPVMVGREAASGVAFILTILSYVFFYVGAAAATVGTVIWVACRERLVTDRGVCEAGDWLIGIGLGFMAASAGFAIARGAVTHGIEASYTLDVDGRVVHRETTRIGPSPEPRPSPSP